MEEVHILPRLKDPFLSSSTLILSCSSALALGQTVLEIAIQTVKQTRQTDEQTKRKTTLRQEDDNLHNCGQFFSKFFVNGHIIFSCRSQNVTNSYSVCFGIFDVTILQTTSLLEKLWKSTANLTITNIYSKFF